MEDFLKKLRFSPIEVSGCLYITYILLFFLGLLVDFIWRGDLQIGFPVGTVITTVQWVCLLIALPLLIVGQKRWSARALLALAASLLLVISMLIDFHRALLAWAGIVILLSMLLEYLIPRAWNFFAESYREISERS